MAEARVSMGVGEPTVDESDPEWRPERWSVAAPSKRARPGNSGRRSCTVRRLSPRGKARMEGGYGGWHGD
jgi:hypothetical protein